MVFGLDNIDGIPLSPIILSNIKERAFGVPLTDVPRVTTTHKEVITKNTLLHLKYVKINGEWRCLQGDNVCPGHMRHEKQEEEDEEEEIRAVEEGDGGSSIGVQHSIPSTSEGTSNDFEVIQHLRDIRSTQFLMWQHQQQMQAQLDHRDQIPKRLDSR